MGFSVPFGGKWQLFGNFPNNKQLLSNFLPAFWKKLNNFWENFEQPVAGPTTNGLLLRRVQLEISQAENEKHVQLK